MQDLGQWYADCGMLGLQAWCCFQLEKEAVQPNWDMAVSGTGGAHEMEPLTQDQGRLRSAICPEAGMSVREGLLTTQHSPFPWTHGERKGRTHLSSCMCLGQICSTG